MARETQDASWPPSVINFRVWLGDENPALFREVSGLESEADSTSYRRDDQHFQPKMPSPLHVGMVTLRRGILARDSKFWGWYDKTKQNIIERQVVVIELLNDAGKPTMKWTIDGAYPTKVSSADAGADGDQIAVESIEMAFETLVVSAL